MAMYSGWPHSSNYICVDKQAEARSGSGVSRPGHMWSPAVPPICPGPGVDLLRLHQVDTWLETTNVDCKLYLSLA